MLMQILGLTSESHHHNRNALAERDTDVSYTFFPFHCQILLMINRFNFVKYVRQRLELNHALTWE